MLIYTPTREPFRVTGLNEVKRDNGTLERVTGIESDGMESSYKLSDCEVSNDQTLMY